MSVYITYPEGELVKHHVSSIFVDGEGKLTLWIDGDDYIYPKPMYWQAISC